MHGRACPAADGRAAKFSSIRNSAEAEYRLWSLEDSENCASNERSEVLKTDVEIFGAGVLGLAIAFACLRRGASVRVIEKRSVGFGASGGYIGALAPHAPDPWNEKKRFQLDSLLGSAAFWKDVENCSGKNPGYSRAGRLAPLASERAIKRARHYSAKALENWGNRANWKLVQASDCETWAPESPTGWLVFDTLSASIHPRRSLLALASAITNLKGEIVEGRTEGIGSKSTILATGWEGLATLEEELGTSLGSGEKGQAALLNFCARKKPLIYADGLYVVPHDDGTVGIGSTSERSYALPVATDKRLDSLIRVAVQTVPCLKDAAVVGRWASIRPRANSRAPLLGRHPLRESVYIANGGFKIGYGIAPGVARAMADLVLDGIDRIPKSFSLESCISKSARQTPR